MSALLVSVRNAAEAEEALAGGAAIIDVKEPLNGPLGRADDSVVRDVVKVVAGRKLVTAALGESSDFDVDTPLEPGVALFKMGLANYSPNWDWKVELGDLKAHVMRSSDAELAVVAYADWEIADAPPPYDVLEAAIELRLPAVLIDTWEKDGSNLLDWLEQTDLVRFCERGRESRLTIGFAGSLGPKEIVQLLPLQPELFAVRGAACDGGRDGTVSRERVAELVALLSRSS